MVTQTSTSLTLRAILKAAASRTALGVPARSVAGLPPAAAAYYVASTPQDATAVLVVPTDRHVDAMVSDGRFFVSAMEGLSDADVERLVLPFPSHEVDPYRGLAPHFEIASARARALHALARGTARVVVASAAALLPRVAAPARLLRASLELAPGDELPPIDLGRVLLDAGYAREDPVDEHGEFVVRGGIVDFFPAGDAQPVRLEFVGDIIESIRCYDASTQRSAAALDRMAVVPLRERFPEGAEEDEGRDAGQALLHDREATVADYVARARRPMLFVYEADEVRTHATRLLEQTQSSYQDATARDDRAPAPEQILLDWPVVENWLAGATRLSELGVDDPRIPTPESRLLQVQPSVSLRGRLGDWAVEIGRAHARRDTVVFVAATVGRAERTIELLHEHELKAMPIDEVEDPRGIALLVATGQLSRGFQLVEAGLVLYAETDVFEEERRVHERRRSLARTFHSDFRDLKGGDHVVHVDHGIGLFVGLRQISIGLETQEFMELRYAGEDKLFVPVERLDLVQKYSGAAHPTLDRLGGTTWARAKTRVRKAMRDMAEELLRLYAARKAITGHAFSPDTHWQKEFDDAFEYELTPDQLIAIDDIKRDMEAPFPMDRLLCGDVGYGKTEVAMRAAFKAVMEGKQVALLAPTTVLAFQHLKTLSDRFAAFPVRIDMVSRFRTTAELKQAVSDLAEGKIDIIVGTHRLLSKDVRFRDLGLVIVDEEQRFGVAHKERLKQLRRKVDVVTMTATPIPRTLNMSLVGIRDMSVIETPPKDRLAIQTNVVKFDQRVISQAVTNELERQGQVYVVHNRVESIDAIANLIARLVPQARLAVAHGQMSEEALERVMVDFVAHKYDILVATTIIENGLDIPNANTIVVNRADRYGLAQLYQLRGRVGRSDRRAYAYLLVPPADALSPVAKKRLAAIREFSDLGSGFRVAALDLEIRGAGNLLGGEQSGHIEAIGYEMYTKLLEQTVRELKGEDIEDEARAAVNLKVDLRIDEDYIQDSNQRLIAYRGVAAARGQTELDRILDELTDRYGAPPPSVLNLVEYGRIRVMADALRAESIDREGQTVVIKFRMDARVDANRLLRLVRERAELTLTPPGTLKLDVRGAAPRPRGTESWWTRRATAGEVKPGFTRAEILRAAPEDPRTPGGLFSRIGELLSSLSPAAAQG